MKSEIFRQAWWMSEDGQETRPGKPLSLSAKDHADLLRWPPVAQTLGQFTEKYEEMAAKIARRMGTGKAKAPVEEGS
jgi:hypothetical protein